MKPKTIILGLLIAATLFPLKALAISAPTYDAIPDKVDANTYTIVFHTVPDATVTVLGGPADIQPVTDGVGNAKDGIVQVMVGLAQEQENVFSVNASLNGQISSAITITIIEGRTAQSPVQRGDTTPPFAPILNDYPEEIGATQYTFGGSSEADANIYARSSDVLVGSGQANAQGIFEVKVNLAPGKTNRVNFSAEDAAGNEGPATQAVIRVLSDAQTPAAENIEQETELVKEELTPRFVDTRGHWAESYINELYGKNIVGGKSLVRFDPNGEITRAELTKIAVNAFGHKVPASVSAKPFADVPVDAWFAPYIAVAKEKGIISGYLDGFHPNEYVNRAAALKILIEASGLPQLTDVEAPFHDVYKKAWFYPYIASAVGHDIISGYADGTFKPAHLITRAEVSKIVVKLLKLLQ